MVQAEEVAATITRKLKKQEKKHLKKEKKRLAAISLASLENSSALALGVRRLCLEPWAPYRPLHNWGSPGGWQLPETARTDRARPFAAALFLLG